MAVIWGLDLRDMQWAKFKSSYMWNNEYHLRRTKFIVYQCAMIFCVVSESLGTAALSGTHAQVSHPPHTPLTPPDYVDQQAFVESRDPSASLHNNDYIGAASYNIFVGIYVATIFGSAFFFDLFWPERHESPAVKLAWRLCSLLAIALTLASALALSVITATHAAYVTGVAPARARTLVAAYNGSPLQYRRNGRSIASLVFLWLGFPSVVASTVLLWMSLAHNDRLGPKSTHARDAEKRFGGAPVVDGVAQPQNAHVGGGGPTHANGTPAYEGV